MRGRVVSAAASVLGHGAIAALLLVGLPWPEQSGAVDEGLQGIEVLLSAGGAPGAQTAPPPEPEKLEPEPEPEKIVEKPVEPPPEPEPEKIPEAITSTAEQPDLDVAPKPAPKPRPKPVTEAPRRPPPPEPVQTVQKPAPVPPPAPPAPPAETKMAALPASPGQSGSKSAPGAGNGAASTSGGNPGIEADYYATLLAWLERHKKYPRRAQMRRQEGVTHLRFTIDGQGHVLAFRVERSSGYRSLDDAVERMIREAEPLPPIPAALGKERLDLVVPVQFFLK